MNLKFYNSDQIQSILTDLKAAIGKVLLQGTKVGTDTPTPLVVDNDGNLKIAVAQPTAITQLSQLTIRGNGVIFRCQNTLAEDILTVDTATATVAMSRVTCTSILTTDSIEVQGAAIINRLDPFIRFLLPVEVDDAIAADHALSQQRLLQIDLKNQLLNGAIGGGNQVFTTTYNFEPNTTMVFKNGLRMFLGDDYTETGANEITYNVAPGPTASHRIDYIRSM